MKNSSNKSSNKSAGSKNSSNKAKASNVTAKDIIPDEVPRKDGPGGEGK